MEIEKKEKKKTPIRKFASQCLLFAIGFTAVAFLAEAKLSHNGHNDHVWPITSNYFFPNLCMLLAWMFTLLFVITVMSWIIEGDE